jgi:RNA polymerase sigma-70 factor (ECF subfamily)
MSEDGEATGREDPPAGRAADGRATTTDGREWSRLIAAIGSRQDRAAFAALFGFFAPRIKAFMRRSGTGEAHAEELAQETMLAIWRKASSFDPASSGAAAWIFTIARNLRIDDYRREQRGGKLEASDAALEFQIDETPQPDSRLAAEQSERRVHSALAQLPPDQVLVVELSFFEDKAHAEIAQTLGIPLGTVKSRLRLAMNRLRNLLGDVA